MRGYSYSNIYTKEIIVKWNQISIQGISLSTSTKINTPRFADDQVIMTLLLLLLLLILLGIISLCSTQRLVFMTGAHCVLCVLRTDCTRYITQNNCSLQRFTKRANR